ncbi:MAG: hypothetical protein LH619_08150 [Chitinophagaceae bacterium]|nr:hypothetical protein [Chitinophagaceae bacterium]
MSKMLFAIVLLLIFSISSFSQPTNSVQQFKTDYLKKSKAQKTAAWILLGGGSALMLAGFIIPQGEVTQENLFWFDEHKNDNVKTTFVLSGTLAMLGSIPFFIASSKNKRKAEGMKVLLKAEKLTSFQNLSFKQISYPALSVRITL